MSDRRFGESDECGQQRAKVELSFNASSMNLSNLSFELPTMEDRAKLGPLAKQLIADSQAEDRTLAEELDESRSVTEYGLTYRMPQPSEFLPSIVPPLESLPRLTVQCMQLVCSQELVSDLAVGEWAARLVAEWPPILVRRLPSGFLILDGHHRACAAASLGANVVCAVLS